MRISMSSRTKKNGSISHGYALPNGATPLVGKGVRLWWRQGLRRYSSLADSDWRTTTGGTDLTEESYAGLTQLGHHVEPPAGPDTAKLERVANPSPGKHYVVRFTCPEFTSLCPVTGQPDFAHIV